MKVKTGKLLRSLIRAGTRTAKLFASAAAIPTPKPKPKRKAAAKRAVPRANAWASASAPAARGGPAAAARRAGAASAVAPGKWLSSHVPAAGGKRMRYWLYLPNHRTERAQAQGLPLLVMLHGCQQTATEFAQGTRMNVQAEKAGYAVLYPQQLVSSHPHRCWKWYDRATQEGGGDVPTIVAMVHKAMTQYPIDRTRIYIAGISAGAGMANIVALNHPYLFAAMGLHSGPVFGSGHNALGALGVMKHGAIGLHADGAIHEILQGHPEFPGMPAILIQGEGDNVVRPINQQQLARQSQLLNQLSGAAKVTHKPGGRHNTHQLHDFYEGRKLVLRVARIDQLAHAWSGGDPTLAFNERAGPDASRMMLEFFNRHQRA